MRNVPLGHLRVTYKECEGCHTCLPWPEPHVEKHHRQAWTRHREACPELKKLRDEQKKKAAILEMEERLRVHNCKLENIRRVLSEEFTDRQTKAVISALDELDLI